MQQLFKSSKVLLTIIGLIVLYVVVQKVSDTYRNPNQMGILESMAMEMEVQVPKGSMPVEIETVTSGSFASTVTYTGSADAYNDVPVFPRTEGWIVSVPVYANDRVKKGQVLARLDTEELGSRLNTARYKKQKAEKAIQAANADLDYWQSEIKRAKALVEEEVITQEEFDREQAQFEAAQSNYEQALAELDAATSDVQTQDILLRYTTIYSPVDGVVTDRKIDHGVFVKPGMELMRIAQLSPIRIQAKVAESDASKIKVGASVLIWHGNSHEETPIQSKVHAIFPERDLKTRTATVEALLPNEDGRFVPGTFVTMSIQVEEKKDVITVPTSAVIDKDQQRAVWVVRNGKAHLHYVTTGGSDGKRIEIVHGIKAGEQVITQGHRDLKNEDAVIATEYGKEGLKALPEVTSQHRLVEANGYQIKQNLEHLLMTAKLEKTPPQMGDNTILIELSPMHGDLPKGLSIEVKPFMPSMPKMTVPKPTVQKIENGQFKIKSQMTMPGLWQFDITLKKDNKTLATTEIQVEAME